MATFDPQPQLFGELVDVRPLRAEDFAALLDAASDPLIWEQHPDDRHLPERFAVFFDEHLASGGALAVVDRRDGRMVGTTRFHGYDASRSEVETGERHGMVLYALRRDLWSNRPGEFPLP